jgi:hypothetical protein
MYGMKIENMVMKTGHERKKRLLVTNGHRELDYEDRP